MKWTEFPIKNHRVARKDLPFVPRMAVHLELLMVLDHGALLIRVVGVTLVDGSMLGIVECGTVLFSI